jgi:hypothetical protein
MMADFRGEHVTTAAVLAILGMAFLAGSVLAVASVVHWAALLF